MEKLEYIKTERAKDSDYDDYSTFLNKDLDLIQKIKNHPKPTSFKYTWEEWTIDSYEGDEVKCLSGKNVRYFSKEEVEEYVKKRFNDEINELYPPQSALVNQFFPLYCYTNYKDKYRNENYENTHISILSSYSNVKAPKNWNLPRYMKGEDYSLTNKLDQIQFTYSLRGSGCWINYDEDGNFVNRDYNLALKTYNQEKPSFVDLYANLLMYIANLGHVEAGKNAKNTFFTQTHCLKFYLNNELNDSKEELNFYIEKLPMREDGVSYKKEYGHGSIVKRPDQLFPLSPAEFLYVIEENFLKKLRTSVPEFNNI